MIVLVTTAPLSVTTWTSVVIAVVDDVTTVRKVEDGVFGAEDVATSVEDGGSVEEGALAFVEDGCEPPPAVPDG